jgi:SAM-dependent methyltransferase
MGEGLTYAQRYLRWWAPVLAPTALRLLDLIEEAIEDALQERRRPVILDVGTGTGTLAMAAAGRWPGANVVGVDPDPDMLAVARAEADREFGSAGGLGFLLGRAEALPLPARSVDALVSSFVLQLVEDRAAALREAARVLRPGGTAAIVTWQGPTPAFPPRNVFSRTLVEFGLEASDRKRGSHNGDGLRSSTTAAAELRRAGFLNARAHAAPLGYRFEPHSFLGWKEHLDERQLFEGLDRARRERLLALLRSRLGRLRPDDFVVPDPVVYVTGRRR